MRGAFTLAIAALCAACAVPAQPVVLARPPRAPPPSLSDCRAFTASAMAAGALRQAFGTACLQADGRWLIIAENPPPAAAIAWAAPLPGEAEQDTAIYYPFDPRDHQSSLFDGGWAGYPEGRRHRGRFRSFGGHRRSGFGAWPN